MSRRPPGSPVPSSRKQGASSGSLSPKRDNGTSNHQRHGSLDNNRNSNHVAIEHLTRSPRSRHTSTSQLPHTPPRQHHRQDQKQGTSATATTKQFPVAPMTITLTVPSQATKQRKRRRRRFAAFLLTILVALSYRSLQIMRQSALLLDDDAVLLLEHHDHHPRHSASLADFDLSIVRNGVARAAEARPLRDSVDDDVESWDEELVDDKDLGGDTNGTTMSGHRNDTEGLTQGDGGIDGDKRDVSQPSHAEEEVIPQTFWDRVAKLRLFRKGAASREISSVRANTTSGTRLQVGNDLLSQPNRRADAITRSKRFRMDIVYPDPPDASIVEEKVQELLMLYPEECRDKEPYLRIILSASDATARRMTANKEALCRSLPTRTNVVKKYGEKPVIVGLDRCEAYRDLLKPENNKGVQLDPMPRVAGLYHCGTNALCRSFNENVKRLPRREFSPYEVPWGKHLPPAIHRLHNKFPKDNLENQERVLPIVIVRDPFFWFQSMCKVRYDAKWEKEPNNRCPNFVRYSHNMTTWPVQCNTHQTSYQITDNYTSLADMWNDWHLQYLDADYPRLMIRFEDTLYRLEEVVNSIRECIGMDKAQTFKYMISRSKAHGNPTDFVASLTKQVGTANRHRGLNAEDRKYAHEILSPKLMETFGYEQCPLEEDPNDVKGPFFGWKIRETVDQQRFNPRDRGNSKVIMTESYRQRYEAMKQRKAEMRQNVQDSRASKFATLRNSLPIRKGFLNN